MDTENTAMQNIILASMVIFLLALVWLILEIRGLKKDLKKSPETDQDAIRLKLQAYERLTLFCERCGLQALIGRLDFSRESIAVGQALLTDTIRSEFEYNQSQQIYVHPEIWQAVTKLKDQNIYIINQITQMMPAQATGADLSRAILQYSTSENAELNKVVLEAISNEARKLL